MADKDTDGAVARWLESARIGVIGLGYVGLPVAVEFAKKFAVVGFDIKDARIEALRQGRDETLETTPEELAAADQLSFSSDPSDLADCNIYIVTVPTPIDDSKRPDLRPILGASETVGMVLKPGDTVIYESTVYPGCTEEDCVPVLERASGLSFNRDFTVGYSPERINPGDREHRLPTIRKIVSGSTPNAAERINLLYGTIITAGTYLAQSIKVAEAAKVIENTQRDLNIALINELSIIFNLMNIDTHEVLKAAGTKWNFLPFQPGLVGGHCIGVDPYYLTHKAEELGYHPHVILAGRRINDGMGRYVAEQTIKIMVRKGISPVGARILILGLSFKENCPDIRNSRVIDVLKSVIEYGLDVDVYDPWVDPIDAQRAYGILPIDAPRNGSYDGIIVAVGHEEFRGLTGDEISRYMKSEKHFVYDIKGVLAANIADARL